MFEVRSPGKSSEKCLLNCGLVSSGKIYGLRNVTKGLHLVSDPFKLPQRSSHGRFPAIILMIRQVEQLERHLLLVSLRRN